MTLKLGSIMHPTFSAPTEHHFNSCLSVVADCIHPFITTAYYLLMAVSSRTTNHVDKLRSSQGGFLIMTVIFCTQTASTQVPDLSRTEHSTDVQPTKLCDAVVSIWTKISQECFQHLVEYMLQTIKTSLKETEGPANNRKCWCES